MARRSIRDLLRKKSRGRKAMTSDMRELIDSFDAHQPVARKADERALQSGDAVTETPEPEHETHPVSQQ